MTHIILYSSRTVQDGVFRLILTLTLSPSLEDRSGTGEVTVAFRPSSTSKATPLESLPMLLTTVHVTGPSVATVTGVNSSVAATSPQLRLV